MIRVGHGYDVHRFAHGRKLYLCGVEIPFNNIGLDGHSDADVAVHALCDALLGSVAMGDIGKFFPDTDPKYKGISSLVLLKNVVDKLFEAGFTPNNIDITIIAQKPKILPYVENMRNILSETMNMPVERINVKATTTEKLGFCGRVEGIAAHCVCTVAEKNDL